MKLKITLLLASFLLAAPARAWNDTGHMAIAAIAWQQFDQPMRDKVAAHMKALPLLDDLRADLLRDVTGDANADTFMLLATWPDAIRPRGKLASKYLPEGVEPNTHWHYINLPLLRPGDPTWVEKEKDLKPAEPNALTALTVQSQVLAKAKDVPTKESAVALCWIEHLTGDVHQPLHCVALLFAEEFVPPEGDQGGNGINTTEGKLHHVWDLALGDRGKSATEAIKIAERIMKEHPARDFGDLVKSDPKTWAEESYKLDKDFVYSLLPAEGSIKHNRVTLTPEYRKQMTEVAEKRAALAGYRLAERIRKALSAEERQ